MNTKQLRQKILDLAIRGQLVPQDGNDEPASVLLEKIRAEKQILIEQKKIKKDKKSSYITCDLSPYQKYTEHFADGSSKDITDEIPFDIPENWAWCRLGEIGVSELGKTLNSNKDTGELTPYLCSINIHWTCINLEEVKKTRFTKEEQRKYILLKNDLLVCEGGDIGRCFIWDLPIPMYYQNALHRIRFYNEINPFFFKFAIEYYKNIHILDKYSKGVTIKHLTKTALHSICFPLPPLAEQKRIVEKMEKLLALVDDLETNKTDLQSYIKQAKSKVLEMAVRGELVPQNPEDEPASALLEHIKKEQKSSKSKGKTTEHNTHYEEESSMINKKVPNGWEICFLRDISSNISSKPYQILQSEVKIRSDIPVVSQSSNYIEGYSDQKNKLFVVDNFVIIFGDHTRNIKYIDFDFIVGADGVKIIKPYKYVTKYIYYLLVNVSEKIENRGYSRHFQFLEKYPLNFPPLEEQHRIVEKIEEIFSELEFIEENLI